MTEVWVAELEHELKRNLEVVLGRYATQEVDAFTVVILRPVWKIIPVKMANEESPSLNIFLTHVASE